MSELKNLISDLTPTSNQFFIKLFELRDTMHFSHLAQHDKRLSTHLALEGVYEEILPIIDGIVEGWSGVMNSQVRIVSGGAAVDNPEVYIQQVYDYLQLNGPMFHQSWIRNEIDNISKILAIALYKLRFVK